MDPASQGKGSAARILFRRVALLLGSLHLTVMAALGLWLWSNPQSFGRSESPCATDHASLAILGARVPFGSNPLRVFSLVIYAVFLLPGFNLLLPMAAFLAVFIWHHKRYGPGAPPARAILGPPASPSRRRRIATRLHRAYNQCIRSSVFPVWVGLSFLLVINVVFITDIELTLHRNQSLQAAGETEWGFGQVLAVLLLFMPLRDLVEMILARRQRRQEGQIRMHEWRDALHVEDTGKLLALVRAGADANIKSAGEYVIRYCTLLRVAAHSDITKVVIPRLR